ncbi:MAG: hypothetical protein M3Q69_01410 [Acidobacteriota bacterium]|nr:hypothetical protein [Acidobacteriota bacterium]
MRYAIAIVGMLLAASRGWACSIAPYDPDAMLENEPVCSANGRFCAIARWDERLPDFDLDDATWAELARNAPPAGDEH